MVSAVLAALKPFISLLPEIPTPKKAILFREKVFWTCVVLTLFLILSQVPLYGIQIAAGTDPLYWLRVMLASNRGTLMELGLGPAITSGLILQLLNGAGILTYDQNNKEERALFQGAQKLIGFLMTLFQACAYTLGGMYGPVATIGVPTAVLIIAQLTITGVIVNLLDEMLTKGYGMGSGSSLFIACNVCESIVWKSFSITTIDIGRGIEFEGAVIAFFHYLITRPNKLEALRIAMFRSNLPNMMNLIATVAIFAVVIYLQGFRVELRFNHRRARNMTVAYPIKLFYTSNVPVMLQSAVISNVFMFSQFLFKRFGSNVFVRLVGAWNETEQGQLYPSGGLIYFLSPPASMYAAVLSPLRTLVYIVFMIATCGLFSRLWIDFSGGSAREVSENLKREGLMLAGHRDDSMVRVLNRYIPVAAVAGGVIVGALTVAADLMGAIGSGTGILLASTTIYSFMEQFAKESL
ncbi:SecY/SEC61-alpha family [Carpediemonas membranifera]|nr:SecY/SEC61-alpha family [Carpediemonas membranifera]|eukprot:KAG9390296.1 SecY/SEC61-alpha family [Carpediemonas membranifera]